MIITIADYKAVAEDKSKSDTVITYGLETAQKIVEKYLNYSLETDKSYTNATCPSAIKLTIILIAQTVLKNIGTGGYSNQLNMGNGTIQIDTMKYYKYFDFIKSYAERNPFLN